jgi:transcriptional regulator with XRE-family HTH domain
MRRHQSTAAGQFGRELYRLRTALRLTQAEVAERAKLGRAYFSQLENSRKSAPPRKTVKRIVSALNLGKSECDLLYRAADAERNGKFSLPSRIPEAVAGLVKQLILSAEQLSPDKLQRIEAILVEEKPM